MDKQESTVEQRLALLRESFDRAFMIPAGDQATALESMLAIDVAGHRLALRLTELSGFQPSRKIMPLPGQLAHLLGVSGIRGRVVPIFDLARFLHYDPEGEQPRWVAVCGLDQPVGLAFAGFEGYLRVNQAAINQVTDGNRNRFLPETMSVEGVIRFVLSIPTVLAELQQRLGRGTEEGVIPWAKAGQ